MTFDLINKYFPELSLQQQEQFAILPQLYKSWNNNINVISRKDIDFLIERHILHSLGIAKVNSFLPNQNVLDVGTGGGFPGVPLAILFPQTQFDLIDSIGKKIMVVKEVSKALKLANVQAIHSRAEDVAGDYNFVVSRAVTRLNEFFPWVKNKFKAESGENFKNGILYLKGGDLKEEITESGLKVNEFKLSTYFEEPFFETKKVIYIPVKKSGKITR